MHPPGPRFEIARLGVLLKKTSGRIRRLPGLMTEAAAGTLAERLMLLKREGIAGRGVFKTFCNMPEKSLHRPGRTAPTEQDPEEGPE